MARILLVDDNLNVREVLRDMLTDRGHTVIEARDGLAALREFEYAGPFNAILTDFQMPRMCGDELTANIRRTGWAGPIAIASGDHSLESRIPKQLNATFLKKGYLKWKDIAVALGLEDA